jgi:ubiquinone/menaquinone biosynthesis C-methylase UbiE
VVREKLYSLYLFFQDRITPGLRFSQYLYQEVLEEIVHAETEWLDLGCGHQIFPEWRLAQEKAIVARCKRVVGVDEDQPSLLRHRTITNRIHANISNLPFADKSFDLVTANMVVEHLNDPDQQFREIARILRPGGLFIFHTPNDRGYPVRAAKLLPESLKAPLVRLLEGRKSEDLFPTFYRANSISVIRELASRNDFVVERVRLMVNNAVFKMFLPLAILELFWIRLLMSPRLKTHRPYLLAVLKKPRST